MTTAVKQTLKAGKRVGKALSIFEKAADELERASVEHYDAADALAVQADDAFALADANYQNALKAAEQARTAGYDRGFELDNLAEANVVSAEKAEAQATSLRSLLEVA